MIDLQTLRYEYKQASLDERHCKSDPFEQFKIWFAEAVTAKPPEPNAMVVSTVSASGTPSSRVVLLKKFDQHGFVFFTNYESHKGQELDKNSKVALLFYWGELERQVRIEGLVSKTSREQSEEYFQKRPRASQLGASCSPQSKVITRAELVAAYETLANKYPDGNPIPCPQHWGGYIVKPNRFEFWQGRESRLHDRIEYRLEKNNWSLQRLAP